MNDPRHVGYRWLLSVPLELVHELGTSLSNTGVHHAAVVSTLFEHSRRTDKGRWNGQVKDSRTRIHERDSATLASRDKTTGGISKCCQARVANKFSCQTIAVVFASSSEVLDDILGVDQQVFSGMDLFCSLDSKEATTGDTTVHQLGRLRINAIHKPLLYEIENSVLAAKHRLQRFDKRVDSARPWRWTGDTGTNEVHGNRLA